MIDYAGLFNVILSLSLNCGFFYVTVLTGEILRVYFLQYYNPNMLLYNVELCVRVKL